MILFLWFSNSVSMLSCPWAIQPVCTHIQLSTELTDLIISWNEWRKPRKNFSPLISIFFSELFGVVPEDFMRKYLGDPPNPTQQPREDPFLKECQAANFTGFSDYASMKLNVTQVFCTPKTFWHLLKLFLILVHWDGGNQVNRATTKFLVLQNLHNWTTYIILLRFPVVIFIVP